MDVFFNKLLMNFLLWILRILDTIFNVFEVLTGVENITLQESGDEISLIDYFIDSPAVVKVFWSLLAIGILVSAVCIIVTVIKNIINLTGGEPKSHSKTVGQGLGSVIISLTMAFIMVAGIGMSNLVLQYVDKAFNGDYRNVTIGQRIIDMSVEPGWEVDWNATMADQNNIDKNGDLKPEDEWVLTYIPSESGYYPGFDINSIHISSNKDSGIEADNADTIFGIYGKDLVFENTDKVNSSGQPKKQDGKIKMGSFNFLIAYISALTLLVVLIGIMLGLVKRIYDLIILMLALPLISGTIPLNDGAYFKLWRETVISKVILAYGAVISVNVFLLFMPLITEGINFKAMGASGTVLKMLLLVGGGLAINGGMLLFARLFGTSAEESRDMTQAFRGALGVAGAAGGALGFIKRALVGGRNRYGGSTKGALGTAAGVLGGGVNAAGNLLGGNAYRGFVNRIKGAGNNVKGALRSGGPSDKRFMQDGGILGRAGTASAANKYANDKLKQNAANRAAYAQKRIDSGKSYTGQGAKAGFDKAHYKQEYRSKMANGQKGDK